VTIPHIADAARRKRAERLSLYAHAQYKCRDTSDIGTLLSLTKFLSGLKVATAVATHSSRSVT